MPLQSLSRGSRGTSSVNCSFDEDHVPDKHCRMEIITIGALLECRIPCVSPAPNDQEPFPRPAEEHPSVNPGEDFSGKRHREYTGGQGSSSSKKRKANCRPIRVSPQGRPIIGHLQLCNRHIHPWNGLQIPSECVALTDSTGTICCCICAGPDPLILGKLVRVISWSYIPSEPVVEKSGESDTPAECSELRSDNPWTYVNRSAARVDHGIAASTCLEIPKKKHGYLEIHNLVVLEGPQSCETSSRSLYVAPLPSDCRQKVAHGGEVHFQGLPLSISPAFLVSGKDPIQNSDEHSEFLSKKPMLGFFLELKVYHTSRIHFDPHGREQSEVKGHELQHIYDEAGQEGGRLPDSEIGRSEGWRTRLERHAQDDAGLVTRVSKLAKTLATSGSALGSRCIFFTGFMSAWRPVLSGALGRQVIITALKKKRVPVGSEKRPYDIFVATRRSLVLLARATNLFFGKVNLPSLKECGSKELPIPHHVGRAVPLGTQNVRRNDNIRNKLSVDQSEAISGPALATEPCGIASEVPHPTSGYDLAEGNLGSENGRRLINFVGVVTDVLFEGTLVELDEHVWLLLTHHRYVKLHGLRIGAIVSVSNAHAMRIKYSGDVTVLLGACMRSHIAITRFSPLSSRPLPHLHSWNLLLKRIQHLPFISSFWLLYIIRSFKLKFCGIHSDKKLLGSKKEPGIIQKYAEKMMAPDVTLERSAFKEFFFHQQSCQLADRLPFSACIRVPPIHHFCKHLEALWQTHRSCQHQVSGSRENSQGNLIQSTRYHSRSTQLIVGSQELGIALLGTLKICQTSRKVQLGDATGMIDVAIPGLLSSEHLLKTYQVSQFTVVVEEGVGAPPVSRGGCCTRFSPISWSGLLKEMEIEPLLSESVTCRVQFHMRDAIYIKELDSCQDTVKPRGVNGSQKPSSRPQKVWVKTKLHLDSMRSWFQSHAQENVESCTQVHGTRLLSDRVFDANYRHKLFQVSCKVVAVRLLSFEWKNGAEAAPSTASQLGVCSAHLICSIPSVIPLILGCFIIDDGSGPADCWAIGDAAVSLLGIPGHLPAFSKLATMTAKFSPEEILVYLVQKYRWIIFQNRSAQDGSEMLHSHIYSDGGELLDNDEQDFQMVITVACNRRPLVVTLGSIPSMEKACSIACKDVTGPCNIRGCNKRNQQDPSFDHSRAVLFAHSVAPEVYTTHLELICDQVAGFLR